MKRIEVKAHARKISCIAIGCFFFWHATAVGVQSVSDSIDGPVASVLKEHLKPRLRPYTRIAFDQRQSWKMFANPRGNVSYFSVHLNTSDGWQEIAMIDNDYFTFPERSHQLKLLRNLTKDKTNRKKILKRYLLSFCDRYNLQSKAYLKMKKHSYPLKKDADEHWSDWDASWRSKDMTSARCPSIT